MSPRSRAVRVAIGLVVLAVAARISVSIPGSAVPQSAQTLAVLVVGALLGLRDGTTTLALYLAVGALGAPVFADGGGGWTHLTGPTAGYLAGFLVAGGMVGALADRGFLRRAGPAVAWMVAGHGLILALGWLRLAGALGPSEAFGQGVGPFLWGGGVKSVLAAGIVVGVARARPQSST
jgi:biotin transport system substrate-specific component